MMRHSFFIVVLGALALFSCQKQTNPISVGVQIPSFVTATGASYRYAVTDTTRFTFFQDSIQVRNDTVTVQILGERTLPDGKRTIIWQRTFRDRTDSILITISGDTALFSSEDEYFAATLALIFPLQDGQTWKYSSYDFSVTTIKLLQIPAGTFRHVLAVKQEVKRIGNTYGYNEYFIDPQVGIVKFISRIFSTMGDTSHRIKWELLNYVRLMED